ncbi:hypothetical protein D3C83_22770 [compost metagenome]
MRVLGAQLRAPSIGSLLGLCEHAARPQDERTDLVRLTHLSLAQPLQRDEQRLLRQVVRGRLVAQMLQPEEAHAGGVAAIQLRFGLGCRDIRCDQASQRPVVDLGQR